MRRVILGVGALAVATCLWAVEDLGSDEISRGPRTQRGEGPVTSAASVSDVGSLTVRLAAPTPYALFRHPDGRGTLHREGEAVFQPDQSLQTFTVFVVDSIAADRVTLRLGTTSVPLVLGKGRALPGPRGAVFVGTVAVDQLEYRHRTVAGAAKPDPSLVALDGSRAILEVEVSGQRRAVADLLDALPELGDFSPVRSPLDTLAQIPVDRVGPTTYEVRAGYWRAIEWATRQLEPTVRPSFFLRGGPGVSIESEVAQGTLNASGFTVTDPRLAARVGVEPGDIIRRVNGQPVNGMEQAVQVVSQTRGAPQSTIRVEIERRGQPMTFTYRLK
jgi:hypothetical protein